MVTKPWFSFMFSVHFVLLVPLLSTYSRYISLIRRERGCFVCNEKCFSILSISALYLLFGGAVVLVQILLEAMLRNNLRQVVYTYVPLSPSSITWYRPKGGDALRLGR